ncbi:hypothetical protein V7S43_017842 [Phytophthora oleae]|uniref:Uncharacterized protein n=1 Tax=Phytophthora oleae TaxID=2107226 RepID=A0ABD3ESL5_9STRA
MNPPEDDAGAVHAGGEGTGDAQVPPRRPRSARLRRDPGMSFSTASGYQVPTEAAVDEDESSGREEDGEQNDDGDEDYQDDIGEVEESQEEREATHVIQREEEAADVHKEDGVGNAAYVSVNMEHPQVWHGS